MGLVLLGLDALGWGGTQGGSSFLRRGGANGGRHLQRRDWEERRDGSSMCPGKKTMTIFIVDDILDLTLFLSLYQFSFFTLLELFGNTQGRCFKVTETYPIIGKFHTIDHLFLFTSWFSYHIFIIGQSILNWSGRF